MDSTWWNKHCGLLFDRDERCPSCGFEGPFAQVFLRISAISREESLKKRIRSKHHYLFFPQLNGNGRGYYAASPEFLRQIT